MVGEVGVMINVVVVVLLSFIVINDLIVLEKHRRHNFSEPVTDQLVFFRTRHQPTRLYVVVVYVVGVVIHFFRFSLSLFPSFRQTRPDTRPIDWNTGGLQ